MTGNENSKKFKNSTRRSNKRLVGFFEFFELF
jgi:hypothetical protein